MRNWASLLPEMLSMICKRVDSFEDLVAFGGVCSTWRHVAVEQNLGQPLLPFPWLMLAENQHDDVRDFYSVTEGKTYSFKTPELRGKMCMETKGWIVTASDKGEMALVHPLTHVTVPLPHQNTSKCYDEHPMDPLKFVKRVVLSAPPDDKNEKDFVLMILHGGMGHIGFCRFGDKSWTVVENNFPEGIASFEYYRAKLYVMTYSGNVWEYDVIGKSNEGAVSSRKIEGNFRRYLSCRQSYLVESSGFLLLIIRNRVDCDNYGTTKLWVLMIDVEQGGYKNVKSLGTRSIFVGHSASLSIEARWYSGLTPNCIYFTDDCTNAYDDTPEGGGANMGVYNLEDKSVIPHYIDKSLSLVCPPIWAFLTSRRFPSFISCSSTSAQS